MRLRAVDIDAEVVNFSSRGLAVRSGRPLETGERYDARLETPDGTVHLKAMVVWCTRVEASGEDRVGTFAAGFTLQSVDQRLDPLADDFVPAREESESLEWPEPDGLGDPGDPGDPLLDALEEADDNDTAGASDLAESANLAPWLAEVMEQAEDPQERSAGRHLRLRVGVVAVILATVAAALAIWLGTGPPPNTGPLSNTGQPQNTGQPPKEAIPVTVSSPPVVSQPKPEPAPDPSEPVPSAARSPAASTEAREATAEAAVGAILVRANVNVRGGPGLDYPVLRRTGANELLPFVSRQGEWFQLQADAESWMHAVTVLAVQEAAGSPESGAPVSPVPANR